MSFNSLLSLHLGNNLSNEGWFWQILLSPEYEISLRNSNMWAATGCTLNCLVVAAQGQLDMEGALTARDRVGIQDFVLLDETTEVAFLGNLRKRFSKDLIYVSLDVEFSNTDQNRCTSIISVTIVTLSFRPTSAHCWCLSTPTKRWTSTIRNKWNSTWVSTFLSFHHTCESMIWLRVIVGQVFLVSAILIFD